MTVDFFSVAIIASIAFLAPLISSLIPGKALPETVLLLLAGAVFGPYMLDLIHVDDTISFLSDLGLAFLFLLAGYDIDTKHLTGVDGRRGLVTWFITLGLAFLLVLTILQASTFSIKGLAVVIALTTTAIGTILSIMGERGLNGTRMGNMILSYGTWGELCPVIAMALLLSTRQSWVTMLILIGFVALAVLIGFLSARIRRAERPIVGRLRNAASTTSQAIIRAVILLLIFLVAVSAIFDLDIVLGAFAAGFILRYVLPEGDEALEMRLQGIAFGFFIPLFFIVSGCAIDLFAVVEDPLLLILFIVALLLVRAMPIYVALSTGKNTRDMSRNSKINVSLYCTAALSLIVAVTSVAVNAGAMNQEIASVLVSAGAVTIFLMPFLANISYYVSDLRPIELIADFFKFPGEGRAILKDHMVLTQMLIADARRETHDHSPAAVPRIKEAMEEAAERGAPHPLPTAERYLEEIRRRNRDYFNVENARSSSDESE